MPHPDYRIVEVPLRLDQVSALLYLVCDEGKHDDFWAGVAHALAYELKATGDADHLLPKNLDWLEAAR